MNLQSKASFLSLPAELRFEVYATINAINDIPMSDFKGLYLSCWEVKAEMDKECTVKMGRAITKAWNEDASGLYFELPKTFATARQLQLLMPGAVLPEDGIDPHPTLDVIRRLAGLVDIVGRLAGLLLESLTIILIHDKEASQQYTSQCDFLLFSERIFNSLEVMEPEPLLRMIVYKHTEFPPPSAKLDLSPSFELFEPRKIAGWNKLFQSDVAAHYGLMIGDIVQARMTDIKKWQALGKLTIVCA
jgi:hypothetical protein